ncbi:MAG: GTPase HflX [Lentisphaerota bacterium]
MIDTGNINRKVVERAILVGVFDAQSDPREADEHLLELEDLVRNLGIKVVDKITVKLKTPSSKFFVGSGKAEEISQRQQELNADCLVFDNDLSPSQQRNWEALTKSCVIDRQEVILDIFADRASTREAKLQVELAKMEYSLPRLTRAWLHLSRQRGGNTGARGEGEKQIEVDRRMVKTNISVLQKELKEVRLQRDTQRKSRTRRDIPHAAIVGYTNAGKSSLLNKITGANVLVEDKLFATLDPTTRKIILPNKVPLLLTDTVGFIRKLPHALVEAFKSTLEEAVLADFLILVLDISSPYVEDHWETTVSVLKELGAEDKSIIIVFNKIDLQHDPVVIARIRSLFPGAVYISAINGAGMEDLQARMNSFVSDRVRLLHLRLPPSRHDLAALIHASGNILYSEYDDAGNLFMTINIAQAHEKKLTDFIIDQIPEKINNNH